MLDKMRLTDTQALLSLGSWCELHNNSLLSGRTSISLNIGGSLVPLGIVIYLLTTATPPTNGCGLIASVVSAAIILGLLNTRILTPAVAPSSIRSGCSASFLGLWDT